MANRKSLKTDTSFLEKISIGAVGTSHVLDDLRSQGHNPIELERGSTSFKLWKTIKIKRIRVPDILCVACGRRVESRAKTTFEISMSHSVSDPERGWDFGLSAEDYVAFALCIRSGDRPIDWQAIDMVQYVPVSSLQEAQANEQVVLTTPKGAQEGFEQRITWPASVASASGTISNINGSRIQFTREADNRTISLSMAKKGLILTPLVNIGDNIVANQVLASVVPTLKEFSCSQSTDESYYLARLSRASLSERYAAAKALASFMSDNVVSALRAKLGEADEHIYVRLEAAASLARHDDSEGWKFISERLSDSYLQHILETVIVLGEIPGDRSCRLLSDVLADPDQHPEIRAGAAWSLGELRDGSSLSVLIDSFSEIAESVRIEAARALAKLAERFTPELLQEFPASEPSKRQGIAWAIGKSGKFSIDDLLGLLTDDDARQWVAYILGAQEEQNYIADIEKLRSCDPEVYFAVTVLWKIMTSWIYDLEEYG